MDPCVQIQSFFPSLFFSSNTALNKSAMEREDYACRAWQSSARFRGCPTRSAKPSCWNPIGTTSLADSTAETRHSVVRSSARLRRSSSTSPTGIGTRTSGLGRRRRRWTPWTMTPETAVVWGTEVVQNLIGSETRVAIEYWWGVAALPVKVLRLGFCVVELRSSRFVATECY